MTSIARPERIYKFQYSYEDGEEIIIGGDSIDYALEIFNNMNPDVEYNIRLAPDYMDEDWILVVDTHDGQIWITVTEHYNEIWRIN